MYNLGAATETAVQNVTIFIDVLGSGDGVGGSCCCVDVGWLVDSNDKACVEQASDQTGMDMDGGAGGTNVGWFMVVGDDVTRRLWLGFSCATERAMVSGIIIDTINNTNDSILNWSNDVLLFGFIVLSNQRKSTTGSIIMVVQNRFIGATP